MIQRHAHIYMVYIYFLIILIIYVQVHDIKTNLFQILF